MGCETFLYLNQRFSLNDIKIAIENKLKTEVEIESCYDVSMGFYRLMFKYKKEQRTMTIFVNSRTSLGHFTQLRLGMDDDGIEIMRIIAEVFGGLFLENDCSDKMEFIDGMFNEKRRKLKRL